jgi:hypothetical protein
MYGHMNVCCLLLIVKLFDYRPYNQSVLQNMENVQPKQGFL